MRVFFHFAVENFANSYIIGGKDGGDAIIVDPGKMTVDMLDIIENNHYNIKAVFVTHAHPSHYAGIRTLLKIYDPAIYSSSCQLINIPSQSIKDGEILTDLPFPVEAISIPGHSPDSLAFLINNALFTGDSLSAGRLGTTEKEENTFELIESIKEKILPLDEYLMIFPGHGPPSSILLEKQFNEKLKGNYGSKS